MEGGLVQRCSSKGLILHVDCVPRKDFHYGYASEERNGLA